MSVVRMRSANGVVPVEESASGSTCSSCASTAPGRSVSQGVAWAHSASGTRSPSARSSAVLPIPEAPVTATRPGRSAVFAHSRVNCASSSSRPTHATMLGRRRDEEDGDATPQMLVARQAASDGSAEVASGHG